MSKKGARKPTLSLAPSSFVPALASAETIQRSRNPAPAILHPQIIITLTPDHSALQAELPGLNGTRRVIPLRSADIAETLLRILQGQHRQKVEIGLDGAPTARQIWHWERHNVWPSNDCPFCIADGRCTSGASRHRPVEHAAGDGSVTVRRVPAKASGQGSGRICALSIEELGI